MTKFAYPNDGIYRYCRNHAEACMNELSHAISNCNFNIPADFPNRSYLSNLENVIRDYYKEIVSINSQLKKTDSIYETLASDLEAEVKNMPITKIKDRDRMIV